MNYSAMADKDMINRYVEYLINQSESKDLQNRSLQLKIDELTVKIVESSSKINELLEGYLQEVLARIECIKINKTKRKNNINKRHKTRVIVGRRTLTTNVTKDIPSTVL